MRRKPKPLGGTSKRDYKKYVHSQPISDEAKRWLITAFYRLQKYRTKQRRAKV